MIRSFEGIRNNGHSFRTMCSGSVINVQSMVSGAFSVKQRTARPQNSDTSSYNSYRICGCETGHVRRVGKTHIYGKGAEVYKSIYIKGTQRR